MHRIDALEVLELLPTTARTAALVNGDAVDVRALFSKGIAVLSSDAASAGDLLDVRLQDSEDGTTAWADVPDGAFTTVTEVAGGVEKLSVDLDSVRPFVRAVGAITGATPSIAYGVCLIAARKDGPDTVAA